MLVARSQARLDSTQNHTLVILFLCGSHVTVRLTPAPDLSDVSLITYLLMQAHNFLIGLTGFLPERHSRIPSLKAPYMFVKCFLD